jgi:hypothetical protein
MPPVGLHFIEERLTKTSAMNPQFSSCYQQHGNVLPPLEEPPEPLYSLPEENTERIYPLIHFLMIQMGCPIILLRNLDPSAGLRNGTQIIITGLGGQVLQVRVLTGSHAGTTAFITQISLNSSASSALPFTLR